jgi:hypothetical protein
VTVRVVTPFLHGHRDRRPAVPELLQAAVLRVRAAARASAHELENRWPAAPARAWDRQEWIRVDRRARSQPGRQEMSGWIGHVYLDSRFAPWFELLAAAELLHVGRATTRGHGEIALTWER